jgi:hypothetical protein
MLGADRAAALPPQGVYEVCAPARSPDGCAGRLQAITDAGFRVVLNGAALDGGEAPARQYAAAASAAGVRVIWPVRANPDAVVWLRDLPATWGYYLWDEPKPVDRPALETLVSRVRALDPYHPRLVVGCGFCAGGVTENVAPWADLDVWLGADVYPVFGQPPDPGGVYVWTRLAFAQLEAVARGPRVAVLQAWRWGDSTSDSSAAQVNAAATRFPTRDEIRAQRDAAGPVDLMLWFTLPDVIGWPPGQRLAGWADPGDPLRRWVDLVAGVFGSGATKNTASVIKARAWITLRRVGRGRYVAFAHTAGSGRAVRWRWQLGRRALACRGRECRFRARRGQVLRVVIAGAQGLVVRARRRV